MGPVHCVCVGGAGGGGGGGAPLSLGNRSPTESSLPTVVSPVVIIQHGYKLCILNYQTQLSSVSKCAKGFQTTSQWSLKPY